MAPLAPVCNLLRSDPADNARLVFANSGPASSETFSGGVLVFPNPYYIDGRNNGELGPEDINPGFVGNRFGAVHFMNLPVECRIQIYTLDGDLLWFL